MTLKEGQSLSLMFPRTRRLSHPQPTLLISLHAWQHQASERLNSLEEDMWGSGPSRGSILTEEVIGFRATSLLPSGWGLERNDWFSINAFGRTVLPSCRK